MDRGIPWNHIGSVWLTTWSWTMDCTGKWKSMYVSLHKMYYLLFCCRSMCRVNETWTNCFVLCFREHTKPQGKRWPNITVMTTSSSSDPYGLTTCLSSASRCSAVSSLWAPWTGFHYWLILQVVQSILCQKQIHFTVYESTSESNWIQYLMAVNKVEQKSRWRSWNCWYLIFVNQLTKCFSTISHWSYCNKNNIMMY